MAEASNESLYGPRKSVEERFPSAQSPGEIWHMVDTSYPKQVLRRPLFDDSGNRLLMGHPLNPRNLVSAQKTYMQRVLEYGYDPNGRGIPEGIEGPGGSTLLLGGKQLALGIYRAIEKDPQNMNCIAVSKDGYQVCLRPKNIPLDVARAIVGHSNLNNRGVKDSVGEKLRAVTDVKLGFAELLNSKKQSKGTLPGKGEYSYHNMYASYLKENWSHKFARWQTFKNSKRCYDNLQTFPLIDDKNMVTAVIDWLDEYGDAEAIEAELDHTLWVMSLWTFKLNQVKNEINKPEEEVRNTDVQLFQELLFCGLEAMVPMYGVGEPGATGRLKGLFGTEPIAAVFTSSLTQEQIEAKMNLIICKIEGEAAKSGSSGPMQQPPKKKAKKTAPPASMFAAKLCGDTVAGEVSWVSTLKSCIAGPFDLLATYGGSGVCSADVMCTVVR